jgi:hypothetical protein
MRGEGVGRSSRCDCVTELTFNKRCVCYIFKQIQSAGIEYELPTATRHPRIMLATTVTTPYNQGSEKWVLFFVDGVSPPESQF